MSRFTRSAPTQWLVDLLLSAGVGEVLTYEKLSEACGEDVRGKARWVLQRARDIVRKERQIEFDVETNVGLQRLDSKGVVAKLASQIDGIRRKARKGCQMSVCVESAELNDAERGQFLARQSYLGLIEHATKRRKVAALEGRISTERSTRQLNMSEMLEALKNGS